MRSAVAKEFAYRIHPSPASQIPRSDSVNTPPMTQRTSALANAPPNISADNSKYYSTEGQVCIYRATYNALHSLIGINEDMARERNWTWASVTKCESTYMRITGQCARLCGSHNNYCSSVYSNYTQEDNAPQNSAQERSWTRGQ